MAAGKLWSRDELLIVLNLYHKLRFRQLDARQPVIIDLADRLGRTSGSVAMKLTNLASLDPALQLRGIRGLPGASNLDRETWDEFHSNPDDLVPQSQELFNNLFVEKEDEIAEVIPGKGIRAMSPPTGATEVIRQTKQRRGQDYFRDIVLNNYDNRCAVTGLPIRDLLIASHILPWRSHETERLTMRNGICLNRLHDAAFDQGFTFDDDLRLILSPKLRTYLPQDAVKTQFEAFKSMTLIIPEDGLPPDLAFLSSHRKKWVGDQAIRH